MITTSVIIIHCKRMIKAYMITQINQILLSIKVFEDSLKIAAQKDDGIISKEEQKIIKKIEKASAKYK